MSLPDVSSMAEAVEVLGTRDWTALVAQSWCSDENIPSVGALGWAHDFGLFADSIGVPCPSDYGTTIGNSVEFEWFIDRRSGGYVSLIVRADPSNPNGKPFIYASRFHEDGYKAEYDVTPRTLLGIIKEYIA